MNKYSLDVSYWEVDERRMLCGPNDQYLKLLENEFDCQLVFEDHSLICLGENDLCLKVIKNCYSLMEQTHQLSLSDVQYLCNMVKKYGQMIRKYCPRESMFSQIL